MRLVAGLRQNPLGELTALPRPPKRIKGGGGGEKGEGEKREGNGEEGGEREREDPQCLKCVDANAPLMFSVKLSRSLRVIYVRYTQTVLDGLFASLTCLQLVMIP